MKIDLGCGINKKDGYVGVDIYDYSYLYGKDFIQADLFNEIPFADSSIEKVYASHFIEHILQDKVIWFFNEIYRILITGGIFEVYFPPTPGRGAWCDPTHRSYWNDLSFRYFDMEWCEQLTKSYDIKCNFKTLENKFINENNHHTVLKKI